MKKNTNESDLEFLTRITNLNEMFGAMAGDQLLIWEDLPTFGGVYPEDTECVWSWDETHLIIGSCSDDLKLISRVDYRDLTGEKE